MARQMILPAALKTQNAMGSALDHAEGEGLRSAHKLLSEAVSDAFAQVRCSVFNKDILFFLRIFPFFP